MGKWLAAIAKGLSYTAGPFKPLVDFVLRLYDGELAEKADQKLQKMIIEGQDTSLEILQILKEIKQTALRDQLVNGTTTILELIEKKELIAVSPVDLTNKITKDLIDSNVKRFWGNGFVSVPTIIEECNDCWKGNQVHIFLAIVENAGFDINEISREIPPFVQISECIHRIFSNIYDKSQRINIVGALAKKAKGSRILRIAHELLLDDRETY
jgi:hypothetical protein